jgi:hypothetical protein
VISLLKKTLVIMIVLIISLMFIIPSGAGPAEVVLDQPVELVIPGTFALVDENHDQKAEALKFILALKAYREGQFIVTGNLEGMKNGQWVAVGTTVVPFQWTPEHSEVELTFHAGNIKKLMISGPYRISVGLKQEDWELPEQIAGFSPKYSYQDFGSEGSLNHGAITTLSEAKRAAETWARYKAIKLGKLMGIYYDYDQWQVNYQTGSNGILRFLVSPRGSVEMLKIKPR